MKPLIVVILLAYIGVANANTEQSWAWTQWNNQEELVLRTIIPEATCPTAKIDGKAIRLIERAASNDAFPYPACEVRIPKHAQTIQVAHHTLTIPKTTPKRILVIGDTGCIQKRQNCASSSAWLFKSLAEQAARLKPDLIIHVGDYFYRPGDTWDTWKADFFEPVQALLPAAHWVFARGNHEDCKRGWQGFARFLEAGDYTNVCSLASESFSVPIGDTHLFVMDSSAASDNAAPKERVQHFQKEWQRLQSTHKPTWLITHKPIWMSRSPEHVKTLQHAFPKDHWPTHIQAIFSGHEHDFEVLHFENRPTQWISGNGGAALGMLVPQKDPEGLLLGGKPVSSGKTAHEYGFLLVVRDKDQWRVERYSANGLEESFGWW